MLIIFQGQLSLGQGWNSKGTGQPRERSTTDQIFDTLSYHLTERNQIWHDAFRRIDVFGCWHSYPKGQGPRGQKLKDPVYSYLMQSYQILHGNPSRREEVFQWVNRIPSPRGEALEDISLLDFLHTHHLTQHCKLGMITRLREG